MEGTAPVLLAQPSSSCRITKEHFPKTPTRALEQAHAFMRCDPVTPILLIRTASSRTFLQGRRSPYPTRLTRTEINRGNSPRETRYVSIAPTTTAPPNIYSPTTC